MIKAIIFDIDNTLYDYDTANAKAMVALEKYTLDNFGWTSAETEQKVKSAYEQMRVMCGRKAVIHNRLIRFQRILEDEGIPLSPHVLNMYDIYWNTLTESSVLFEGLPETLEELKDRGIKLGIGTNMTSVMQFRKLEALGLLRYFDFIVSSEEAGSEKPDKVLFMMCVRKTGFHADECMYIGDNLKNDVQAALRWGLRAAWFCPDKEPIPDGMPVPVDHLTGQEADDSILKLRSFRDLPRIIDIQ